MLIIILLVLVLPVAVSGTSDDEMLKKAQNLNITVPQKGTSMSGTKESMTEMMDWLNACTDAILSLFRDVMNLFGLGNTSYSQQMTKTLGQGANLSKAGKK
jgi:hypothetical protein